MSEIDLKAIARTDANFCRVFRLPKYYPTDFCFGGGHQVEMIMVDWFNPIPDPGSEIPGSEYPETWADCEKMLIEFLKQKKYVEPGAQYLVLTDFGEAFTFSRSWSSEF